MTCLDAARALFLVMKMKVKSRIFDAKQFEFIYSVVNISSISKLAKKKNQLIHASFSLLKMNLIRDETCCEKVSGIKNY